MSSCLESEDGRSVAPMCPALLLWEATETGVKVQVGQLGLLIVRKVNLSFEVAVFGKCLKERSVTIDEGKERAELAARRWVAQAGALLWSKTPPVPEPPPLRTSARPGGIIRKAKA